MQSSEFENQDQNLKNIERKIKWSIRIAILLIVGVISTYFINFHGEIDSDHGTWGTFGDFVGGTLNPVLAAFAFYWLTSSIRLQLQELRDTRDVLKETSDHQQAIAELEKQNVDTQQEILVLQRENLDKQIQSAKEQQKQIAIQNFENIFFELIKTKNDVIQDITYEYNRNSFNSRLDKQLVKLRGKEAICKYINDFKTKFKGTWKEYYENELVDSFSPYFRVCYQIVRLIDNNDALKNENFDESKYSHKQKQYFDIFKATLQQAELESLFFNGLSGFNKYKKIIEKYGMFEPLIIDVNKVGLINLITQYAYMYNKNAFCDNDHFSIYFEDISKINYELDFNLINSINNILIDNGIFVYFYPDEITRVLGFKGADFSELEVLIQKFIEEKDIFISERENEILKSDSSEFKKRTSDQINSIKREIEFLKDTDYMKAVYALVQYRISYDSYRNFFKNLKNN